MYVCIYVCIYVGKGMKDETSTIFYMKNLVLSCDLIKKDKD